MLLKQLKNGEFFKLKENGNVLVKSDYDRTEKKYYCFYYDDVNHSRYVSGDKEIFTDFVF